MSGRPSVHIKEKWSCLLLYRRETRARTGDGENGRLKEEGKGGERGCVLPKRKKQKARPKGGKPKGTLESESRNAIV